MQKLKVLYDDALNIVIAEAEGMVTGDNVRKTIFEALECDKAHNCKTVLVDITRCKVNTLYLDAFMSMHRMAEKYSISPGYKFAVVFNPDNYPEERARFIEAISKVVGNP